jgi:hypothetical protein
VPTAPHAALIIRDIANTVGSIISASVHFGGQHCIRNSVSRMGVMGRYRVKLFDRRTHVPIREVWSNANGDYVFDSVEYRYKGYFVAAFDDCGSPVNAAIGDYITPESML